MNSTAAHRFISGLLAGAMLSTTIALTGSASASTEPTPQEGPLCRSGRLPVSLAPNLPKTEFLNIELCLPASGAPQRILLTIPGGTYNSAYWDFPTQDWKNSFVRAATAAGNATANMDRIGTGASSHPASALITPWSDAWTVHQLVTALRRGQVPGLDLSTGFTEVVLVAHSYGTVVAWLEASTYQDVTAVVLTGFSHRVRLDSMARLGTNMYPALLDTRFRGRHLDPGYLTTRPGTRNFFTMGGTVDPAITATDENTKDVAAATSFTGLLPANPLPLVKLDIRAPVFLAVGEQDPVVCGPALLNLPLGGISCDSAASVIDAEAPYLGPHVPRIDGYVLPDAGHSINLAPNAALWFDAVLAWLDSL